uniref:Uncharacterized protein n=1 Tax=Utricularia reniformis TaxID=192314 RepID=A0A1Y0AYW6_9LAMI|nr:hypothetical protein AEK19_MT0750 [Utricularia reniformis]ART30309.1 hypothetical protein AEK19_MT0750 [Utricularia reniformis]
MSLYSPLYVPQFFPLGALPCFPSFSFRFSLVFPFLPDLLIPLSILFSVFNSRLKSSKSLWQYNSA